MKEEKIKEEAKAASTASELEQLQKLAEIKQEDTLHKISEYFINENVKVTKFSEDAKFEGPPPITPMIPYFYQVHIKKTDPQDKFFKRFADKSRFIQQDFVEYLKDIAMGR